MTTGLLITNAGQAALAADLGGGADLVLTHVAVGDANGVPYVPNAAQAALVNERYRMTIASVAVVGSEIVVDAILPADTPDAAARPSHGFNVHEIGLFSAGGTLIGVARMSGGYKPPPSTGQASIATFRLKLAVANPSAITVAIDPQAQIIVGRHVRPFWMTVDGLRSDPPPAPALGATYAIGAAPTGAWTGFVGRLAQWVGVWSLATVPNGHQICDASKAETDPGRFLKLAGGLWLPAAASETAQGPTRMATLAEAQGQAADALAISPKNSRFLPLFLDQVKWAGFVGVRSITQTAQPGGPAIGDVYVIPAAGAIGPWAAHPNKVAVWTGSDWFYFVAPEGMFVRADDSGFWRRRAGGAWANAYAGATDATAGVVTLADLVRARDKANSLNPLTPATLAAAMSGALTYQEVVTVSQVWTVPTGDDFVGIDVELIAGGAGGGLSSSPTATRVFGGGGSNGVYLRDTFSRAELMAIGATILLTVGFGGAGRIIGAGAGPGTAGGDTSFGTVLVAKGGLPGAGGAGVHGAGGASQTNAAGSIRAGRTFQVAGLRGGDGDEIAGITFPGTYGSIGQGGQGGYATSGGPSASASDGAPGAMIITKYFN